MESCLYTGSVRHRRYRPVAHAFRYPLALTFLDLEELSQLLRGGTRLRGVDRWGVASFRRRDHLGDPRQTLSEAVREFIASQGKEVPTGPIRLLTHLRYFGYGMNPVSFYFCYAANGVELAAVVAEVNNTPWGEQHCYLLEPRQFRRGVGSADRLPKAFHVSPFMSMHMAYSWRLSPPGPRLAVAIENYEHEEKMFDVSLVLRREELTARNFTRFLWRYPAMTWQVTAAIYTQALKLWWKGCPFFPHPRRAGRETVAAAASLPS